MFSRFSIIFFPASFTPGARTVRKVPYPERAVVAPSCAQGTLPYKYSTRYLLWCEALGQCGGLPSHADDASQLQRCPPNHHHPCPSPRNP